MNVSEYIWKRLHSEGVTHVFTLSGGGCMHLTDALGRSGITVVPMHHEQACAFAAMSYSRAKPGNLGVCLVTSGPGGTNAITGVAAAWMDSIPMLVISGNVSTDQSAQPGVRQRGFQEFDIITAVESFTKRAYCLDRESSTGTALDLAIRHARSVRPGPTWIDIPLDVQTAEISEQGTLVAPYSWRDYTDAPVRHAATSAPLVAERLRVAKRPLIYLGGGVVTGSAVDAARKLVNASSVPVQCSWNALDVIPSDASQWFGRPSFYGPRYANFIIQNADYILSIGSRLGVQTTGWNVKEFAPNAEIDMIDLSVTEARKPGLGGRVRHIECDAGGFLQHFSGCVTKPIVPPLEWLDYCSRMRGKYSPGPVTPGTTGSYVDPYYFYHVLSDMLDNDAVVALGSSGTAFSVAGQVFRSKAGQRVYNAKGMAAMGSGIPMAIGAHYATGRRVVTVVGDGGFQLNIQELQTIRHNYLPIKIFVLADGGYNAIQTTQRNNFNGRMVGSDYKSGVSFPNLNDLSICYGTRYCHAQTDEELPAVIADALSDNRPTIIQIDLEPGKPLLPRSGATIRADGTFESRPLQDLVPLLDREEYRGNML